MITEKLTNLTAPGKRDTRNVIVIVKISAGAALVYMAYVNNHRGSARIGYD
jgi:hypothetical protein